MHVLSFLGTGSYKTTIYEFPEPVKTQYFIEALTANLDPPPTKITVFVTRESEVMHFPLVLEKLRTNGFKDSQVQKIKIPAGQTVDELWEIFNQVISAVDVGEEIVFDITHSLRFLPVITFLTLIYLRSVKDIKINELYYGAYTQERLDNTPVFRLSGFLDIFDWLEGADSFIKY
ncbi:MAG: TIGR02221 family CRISPR-associated protein, partial [Bacteroidota bacterium]